MAEQSGLSLKKNILWNSVGALFYLITQWLTSMLALILSADFDNAGVYSLAMSVTVVFNCVALYSMRTYQVADISGRYPAGVYVASRFLTCGAGFVLCAVYAFAGGYTDVQISAIILYMVYKVTEAFMDVCHGVEQRADRMDYVGKSFLLRGAFSFIAFVGVLVLWQSLTLAIAAMAAAGLLVVLLYDRRMAGNLADMRPAFNWPSLAPLIKECFWLFACTLVINAVFSCPKIFLERYHGNELLGIYASAASPTMIVQAASSIIYNPLVTSFTHALRRGDKKAFSSLFI